MRWDSRMKSGRGSQLFDILHWPSPIVYWLFFITYMFGSRAPGVGEQIAYRLLAIYHHLSAISPGNIPGNKSCTPSHALFLFVRRTPPPTTFLPPLERHVF